jgi:cytidylate kinase
MPANSLADSLASALVRATDYNLAPNATTPSSDRPPFSITISREPGASGTAVAREVGQRLGWPTYDEELLNFIAREMGTSVDLVKLIDEKPVSFLEHAVITMVSDYNLNQDSYMVHLVAAVRALGAKGRCLIVGRGATFMLPPLTTLRVRLVADLHDRIAAITRLKSLSDKEAAQWIDRKASERRSFVKKHFSKDVTDAHHYDLVLNASRWSVPETAELIIDALQRIETHKHSRSPGE